jgi:hypothetical protein
LFVAGGVGGTSQTGEVDQRGTADVVGNALERELEGVEE